MKYYLRLILIGIIPITLSCSNDKNVTEIFDLRVNHFQQTAVGVGQQLVIQIQEGNEIGTDQWSYFYSNIEGFEYESGFIYTLSVEKQKISNPPEDSSSIKYILRNIISKEKIANDITFEIQLKSTKISNPPSFVTGSSPSNYKILDEIEIDCKDLCEDLSDKLQTKNEVSGIFKHSSNRSIVLVSLISE